MNKTRQFILRDESDSYFDDLITFDEDIDLKEVYKLIKELKQDNPEYSNEDVYNVLQRLGAFNIVWLGNLKVIEY